MKKIIFTAFVLLSAIVALPQNSSACSVMAGITPQQNYDNHAVVFVGKVTSVTKVGDEFGEYRIQFETSKVYKGDFDHSVVITVAGSSAACGYDEPLGIFNKGSIWAIYASEELHSGSVSQNQQYESLDKAYAAVDALSRPTMCTMQYDPVCGKKDTGIRCVTTPCPSSETKTYGNSCMLGVDGAEFLYKGECRPEDTTVTPTDNGSQPDDFLVPTTTDSVDIEVEPISAKVSVWTRITDFFSRVFFFWR